MHLHTVLVTPQWTLDRPNDRAHVTCELALVQDETDDGLYELRIILNGEVVYTRVWETQEEALADSDAALRALLGAGWRRDRDSVFEKDRLAR